MSQDLIFLISELKDLSVTDGQYVHRFEQILFKITNLDEPDSILLLPQFFNDNSEHDELMFSLIHSIEQFDDIIYATKLIQVLPNLYENAPFWCSVLLKRVRNNKGTEQILNILLESKDESFRNFVNSIFLKN